MLNLSSNSNVLNGEYLFIVVLVLRKILLISFFFSAKLLNFWNSTEFKLEIFS